MLFSVVECRGDKPRNGMEEKSINLVKKLTIILTKEKHQIHIGSGE
jgi:hypothetical protein